MVETSFLMSLMSSLSLESSSAMVSPYTFAAWPALRDAGPLGRPTAALNWNWNWRLDFAATSAPNQRFLSSAESATRTTVSSSGSRPLALYPFFMIRFSVGPLASSTGGKETSMQSFILQAILYLFSGDRSSDGSLNRNPCFST